MTEYSAGVQAIINEYGVEQKEDLQGQQGLDIFLGKFELNTKGLSPQEKASLLVWFEVNHPYGIQGMKESIGKWLPGAQENVRKKLSDFPELRSRLGL